MARSVGKYCYREDKGRHTYASWSFSLRRRSDMAVGCRHPQPPACFRRTRVLCRYIDMPLRSLKMHELVDRRHNAARFPETYTFSRISAGDQQRTEDLDIQDQSLDILNRSETCRPHAMPCAVRYRRRYGGAKSKILTQSKPCDGPFSSVGALPSACAA